MPWLTKSDPGDGCFGVAFLAFWSAITLTADGVLARAVARQCVAYTFAETTGTVTDSRVVAGRDSDGDPSYRLEVRYAYTVGGRAYVGERYCYRMEGFGDRSWHRVQEQLPKGTAVPVYYDPAER